MKQVTIKNSKGITIHTINYGSVKKAIKVDSMKGFTSLVLAITLVVGLSYHYTGYAAISPSNTKSVVNVITNVIGGPKVSSDFNLHLDFVATTADRPSALTNFSGDPTGTYTVTGNGHVTVTEDSVPNYVTTLVGDCNTDIILGELKTCTITNTFQPGTLNVIVNVVNDGGGTKTASQFTVTASGTTPSLATFPGSSVGTSVTFAAGSYSVSTLGSGYTYAYSAGCTGVFSIGGVAGCTITADDIASGSGGGGGVEGSGTTTTTSDISILKTASATSLTVGQTLTYSIVVKNNGPADATNVLVAESVPTGTTLVSTSTTQGVFNPGAWVVGNLLNGATATLTLVTTVNAGTEGSTITNSVSASATQVDSVSTNNTASVTGTVPALVSGGGGGGSGPLFPGGNGGNGGATGTGGGGFATSPTSGSVSGTKGSSGNGGSVGSVLGTSTGSSLLTMPTTATVVTPVPQVLGASVVQLPRTGVPVSVVFSLLAFAGSPFLVPKKRKK